MIIRLLADENIPSASVAVLRKAGHDVVHIGEALPGGADAEVLSLAASEERILVTFDRDFGALVFLDDAPLPSGVLLLRFVPRTPAEAGQVVADALTSDRLAVDGVFTVLDRERVRQRQLPTR